MKDGRKKGVSLLQWKKFVHLMETETYKNRFEISDKIGVHPLGVEKMLRDYHRLRRNKNGKVVQKIV